MTQPLSSSRPNQQDNPSAPVGQVSRRQHLSSSRLKDHASMPQFQYAESGSGVPRSSLARSMAMRHWQPCACAVGQGRVRVQVPLVT